MCCLGSILRLRRVLFCILSRTVRVQISLFPFSVRVHSYGSKTLTVWFKCRHLFQETVVYLIFHKSVYAQVLPFADVFAKTALSLSPL